MTQGQCRLDGCGEDGQLCRCCGGTVKHLSDERICDACRAEIVRAKLDEREL